MLTTTIAASPTTLRPLAAAAAQLAVSPWTLRAWARQGRIATVKLGSRVMLADAEIARVIAAGTRPARQPQPWGGR